MVYIVGVVSQKGGAGKSTISRALATELAKGGLSVKIADLDVAQGTSSLWAKRRAENGIEPMVRAEVFRNLKTAIGEAHQFDGYIIDGQPHASRETLEIARAADLVVIPTGQAVDDLHPAMVLAHDLVGHGLEKERFAFAMFRTSDSDAELAAAREYLTGAYGYRVLNGAVPNRTAYGKALDEGRSIAETRFRSLNERAETLCQHVIDLLAGLPERKAA